MAHTFGNSAVVVGSSLLTVTTTLNCAAGTTLLVLTLEYNSNSTRTGAAPAYNGVSLTQVSTGSPKNASSEVTAEIWYMLNPPTGSAYTLWVSNPDNFTIRLIGCAFSAATGSGTRFDVSAGWAGSGSPSNAVTAARAGSALVDAMAHSNNGVESARTQTLITGNAYDEGAWNSSSTYAIAGPGSVTFGHTRSPGDYAHIIGCWMETLVTRTIQDAVVVSDTVTVAFTAGPKSRTVQDAVVVSDTVTVAFTAGPKSRTVQDAVSVSDAGTVEWLLASDLGDTAYVDDSIAVVSESSRSADGSVDVTDQITVELSAGALGRTVSDSVDAADYAAGSVDASRIAADAVDVGDESARITDSVRAVIDAVVSTDLATATFCVSVTVYDSIDVIDDVARSVDSARATAVDEVVVSDSASYTAEHARADAAAVDVTDATVRVTDAGRSVADSADVTDSLVTVQQAVATVSDSVIVADAVARHVAFEREFVSDGQGTYEYRTWVA